MSLVNEALKKARVEAARQDAARRGIPLPGAHRPMTPPIGGATLFKAGAAILIVGFAVLIFLAGRRSSHEPSPAPAAEPPVAAPAEVPAGASKPVVPSRPAAELPVPEPAAAPAAVSKPAAPPRPAADRPAPAAVAPGATRPAARVRAEAEPAPPPAAALPPAAPVVETAAGGATAEPRAAESAPAPPQVAIRTLELPGARRIELGGIAWSEERPFALINGRVVGTGDQVEKLTIVGIEPRHVELSGQDGHYLLRLK